MRRLVALGVAVGLAVPLTGVGAAVGAGQASSGGGWSSPERLSHLWLGSVSCVAQFCIATATFGEVFRYERGSWGGPIEVDTGVELEAVSCGSPSFCVTVDVLGRASIFDGHDWSAPKKVDKLAEATQVSCVGGSFCAVVDEDGNVTFLHRHKWSKPEPSGVKGFGGPWSLVSCSSSTNCMVVAGADATQWDGLHWSDPVGIDNEQPASLSCTSASFCIAVDDSGRYVRFTGTRWTHRRKIQRRVPGLTGVSCTSESFCITVDGRHARQWNGEEWGDRTRFDRRGGLGHVSCSSPTFCAVVTSKGDAIMYTG